MLKFEVVTPNVIRLQINNMISVIYPVNIVFGQLFFLLLSAVWILGRYPGTPPAVASPAYGRPPVARAWRIKKTDIVFGQLFFSIVSSVDTGAVPWHSTG